jgi:hypothetical protein
LILVAPNDGILPAVQALGSRHRGYGVSTEHYAPVGAALLWTLEQGLGAAFTPDVKADVPPFLFGFLRRNKWLSIFSQKCSH